MPDPSDIQPRVPAARRVGVALLVAFVGIAGWSIYDTLARAKVAADSSCLAAVHAALMRRGVPGAMGSAQWEEWPHTRIREALATLGDVGDCSMNADAPWRTDVRVQSRVRNGETELELWLASRSNVRSPHAGGGAP